MSIELKIKAKSLTAEARIIRSIERRLRKQINRLKANAFREPKSDEDRERWISEARAKRDGVQSHRRFIVGAEARNTHLARGCLRGVPYRAMETKVHPVNRLTAGDWKAIDAMVTRYGEGDKRDLAQRLEQWKQEAADHLIAMDLAKAA